ncbi:glycosyltransferase family 4 protein [Candidatus Nomurabacteria bacterium]|nr:glycosyltransferase family 4 protein [Candidatus Nomurabacteria bacterium]
MNIGIDIRPLLDSPRTGVGEFTYEFLDAILHTDHKNQYFLFYGRRKVDRSKIELWKQRNVTYRYVGLPSKVLNFLTLFGIIKLDRFFEQELDYFVSLNIGFSSVSSRCKRVQVVHDMSYELCPSWYNIKRRIWHWILHPRRACKKATFVITPSHNTSRDVTHQYGIKKDRVHTLRPGVGKEFLEYKRGLSEEKFFEVRKKYSLPEKYLLFLGTIEPRKNIEGVIDGFERWNRTQKEKYTLVIAGTLGWKYKSVVKKMKSTQNVMPIGYVDACDKPALYQMAEIFVYPSFYEGFGFPVLEAQSVGTSVVTSSNSSLVEVADEFASLVDPYSVTEIEKAIAFQIDQQKRYNEENKVEYSWGVFVQEFLHLLSLDSRATT